MLAAEARPEPERILSNVVSGLPGLEAVPFQYDRPFPGTMTPTSSIEPFRCDSPNHIGAYRALHDFRSEVVKERLAELVDGFREKVASSGFKPEHARPLPHPPQCVLPAYVPIRVDGMPVRLLLSYSFAEQAFMLSADAFFEPSAQ
jgi:hypothetical protein